MSRKTFKRDSVHVVYKTVRESAPIGLGNDNMTKETRPNVDSKITDNKGNMKITDFSMYWPLEKYLGQYPARKNLKL